MIAALRYCLGLLAIFAFASAGIPAASVSHRTGATSTSLSETAWLIVIGCLMMWTYLTWSFGFDPVVTVCYVIEVAAWGTVLRYYYWPRSPRSLG